MGTRQLAKVVLPAGPGLTRARSARLLMPDGARVPGVRCIEVIAGIDGALMARVELFCEVETRRDQEPEYVHVTDGTAG